MQNKIIAAVVGLVLLGAGFYGGMSYGKSAAPAGGRGTNGAYAAFGANGQNGQIRMMGGAGGRGNVAAGQILSKDASSMTVKMQDGSTKIVLLATSTEVFKQAQGSLGDLAAGTDVVITGSANGDGSLTAASVQIRPAGAGAFGRGMGAPGQ